MRWINQNITGKKQASVILSPTSGNLITASGLVPEKVIFLGVTTEILETITGATSLNIGDGFIPDIYADGTSVVVGTKTDLSDHTSDPLRWTPTSEDVEVAAIGGNFTGGSIRVTTHWLVLA